MNKKTHFSGCEHPLYIHGRYCGEKKKTRKATPKTGVTARVEKWIVERRSAFTVDEIQIDLRDIRPKKISDAVHGLHRRGKLEWLEHIGNQHKIWRLRR